MGDLSKSGNYLDKGFDTMKVGMCYRTTGAAGFSSPHFAEKESCSGKSAGGKPYFASSPLQMHPPQSYFSPAKTTYGFWSLVREKCWGALAGKIQHPFSAHKFSTVSAIQP